MYRSLEKSTLQAMNDMRRPVIWLLLIALSVSSSAGAATSCIRGGEQAATQMTIVDTHARHGSAQHGSHSQPRDAQETTSHHDLVQGDDSAPADCPCCDNCATMCVLSGCSPAVITSVSPERLLRRDDPGIPLADAFHLSPTPHPLFRPPIPIP